MPICCTVYLWVRSITVSSGDGSYCSPPQCLNQLTFVEKIEESDGAAWKVVMYRILASLSMMIIFTGLGESAKQGMSKELKWSAIALKTRSAALSATAFLPLLGPAYLVHLLRTGYKPENLIEILKEVDSRDNPLDSLSKYAPTAVFRHALLDPDWAPRFLHHVGENKKFAAAIDEFGQSLRELVRGPKDLRNRVRRRRRKYRDEK